MKLSQMTTKQKHVFYRNLFSLIGVICLVACIIILIFTHLNLHPHHQVYRNSAPVKTEEQSISSVGWHKGMPFSLQKAKLWHSKKIWINHHKIGTKYYMVLSKFDGGNPFLVMYNKHNQPYRNGNVGSATGGTNPYYKKVNPKEFEIIDGNSSLRTDLRGYVNTHGQKQLATNTNYYTVYIYNNHELILWNGYGKNRNHPKIYKASHQSLSQLLDEIKANDRK